MLVLKRKIGEHIILDGKETIIITVRRIHSDHIKVEYDIPDEWDIESDLLYNQVEYVLLSKNDRIRLMVTDIQLSSCKIGITAQKHWHISRGEHHESGRLRSAS